MNDRRWTNIIFDFDGVMVDSNMIRAAGFRDLYPDGPVAARAIFNEFIEENPGLSRYRKIRHYHEQILGQPVSDATVEADAARYSEIVLDRVAVSDEIAGAEAFLADHVAAYRMALVSASDQTELRQICERRGISKYFTTILGSPTEKAVNIASVIADSGWRTTETVYVGDSSHDRIAARSADIDFIAFGPAFPEGASELYHVNDFAALGRLFPLRFATVL